MKHRKQLTRRFVVELGTYGDDVAAVRREEPVFLGRLDLRDGHVGEYSRPVSINRDDKGQEVAVEIVSEVVLCVRLHLG